MTLVIRGYSLYIACMYSAAKCRHQPDVEFRFPPTYYMYMKQSANSPIRNKSPSFDPFGPTLFLIVAKMSLPTKAFRAILV